jgi:hypothetical protein
MHMEISDFGKVLSWDEKAFIHVAQILVDADEAERALWLLTDGLPAYYRDNTPPSIVSARNKITMACMTTSSYKDCEADTMFCDSAARGKLLVEQTLRGQLCAKSIKAFNDKGKTPHLIDLGPGEYWLPVGLKACGLKFGYQDLGVNESTKRRSDAKIEIDGHLVQEAIERHTWNGEDPVIFVGLEIIEHLSSTKDLLIECLRITKGVLPDEIHLSTPLYTYHGDAKPIDKLDKNGLPHLRAYTPTEFHLEAVKVFGLGYDWELHLSPVMSLVGRKK